MQKNLESNNHKYGTLSIKNGRISNYFNFQPSDFIKGRLEGVFQNSLNICLGEELLHMGSHSQPLCCFGIAVSQREMEEILNSCENEQIAVLKKNRLTIYGFRTIELDLNAMEQVDLRLPPVEMYSGRQIQKLAECLPDSFELGLTPGEELTWHMNSLCRLPEPSPAILEWFLGRGQGLTPSGDDILTGFGLSRWLTGRFERYQKSLSSCDLSRTTKVGAAYLKLLQKGFANENVIALLNEIEKETPEQLKRRIEEIRRLGHTSGNDLLFGLKAGLKAFSQ